jgi:hypothetical protein
MTYFFQVGFHLARYDKTAGLLPPGGLISTGIGFWEELIMPEHKNTLVRPRNRFTLLDFL